MTRRFPLEGPGSSSRRRLRFAFAGFSFEPESGELRRDGATVELAPQPAVVLEVLLRRAGEVVPREDLYAAVWDDDTHVDYEHGLNYCIRQVRIALDDDAREPRFVETLPRRGYRFLVRPTLVAAEPALRAPGTEPATRPSDTGRGSGASATAPAPAGADARPSASPSRPFLSSSGRPSPRTARLAGLALLATLVALGAVAILGGVIGPDGAEIRGPGISASASPAMEPYLTARYLASKGIPETERAIREYRRALRADPSFAPALAGLAEAYRLMAASGQLPPETGYSRSLTAADRALELGHGTADVHVARGIARLYLELDWKGAASAFDRARRVEPENARAWFWHARALSATGDHDDAVRAAKRALVLDPESRQIVADLGWFHVLAGRYEDAVAQCEHALELEPRSIAALQCLLAAHSGLGDRMAAATASQRMAEVLGASDRELGDASRALEAGDLRGFWEWNLDWLAGFCPRNTLATSRASILTLVGDHDAAIGQLEEAVEARHFWAPFIAMDPTFAELRDDPRFRALLGAE